MQHPDALCRHVVAALDQDVVDVVQKSVVVAGRHVEADEVVRLIPVPACNGLDQ